MGGFGGVIKLTGEKEYREALQQIRQSLRETGSKLSALSSDFKNNERSIEHNKNTIKELRDVLKKQSDDYEKLKTSCRNLTEIYEKNKIFLNNLEQAYKNAKRELEKIEIELGKSSESYKAQAKAVDLLEQNLEKETKRQSENEAALSRVRTELNNAEAAMHKTTKEVNNLEIALKDNETTAKKASSTYEILKAAIENQEDELKKLKDEYKNVILQQGDSSEAAKGLATKISDLSNELRDNKEKLNDAEKAAENLSDSMGKASEKAEKSVSGFSVFKTALANLVSNTIQKAIDKIKELTSNIINVGMDFDASMSEVRAISGATGEEFQQLREKAKEMGKNTKFTATDAAQALKYMAIAGWDTKEMLAGIEPVMDLAAASGEDLARTSDIVTDAMTAMRKEASKSAEFVDVLTVAATATNTDVGKMGYTFQYVAPVLGAFGYSIQDAAIAIGMMADAGIKSEKAGTALRNILTRLSTDAGAGKNSLGALGTLTQKLGVEFYDASGKARPLIEVIDEARGAWVGLSDAEQAAYAKTIAGQDGIQGWLALMGTATEKVDLIKQKVEQASGTAKRVSETMLDNTKGDMTTLNSKLESVQITIYEKFEPALRRAIEWMKGLTDAVQFVIDHQNEFNAAIAGMAAAVAGYVGYTSALKIMKDGWKALAVVQWVCAGAQWAINAAMGANPIGLVVGLVAGLTTAFVILWNNSEGFRNFWIRLWEDLKRIFGKLWEFFKKMGEGQSKFLESWGQMWANVYESAYQVWGKMSKWFSEQWNNVKKVFGGTKNFFKEKFSDAWDAVRNVFSGWSKFFSNLWDNIRETFSTAGTNIANAIGGAVKKAINNVISLIEDRINFAIRMINGVIDFMNMIPGVELGRVEELSFPRLAQGGVLDNGPRHIIAGENGAEAVVPLENNTKWVKAIASQLQNSLTEAIPSRKTDPMSDMKARLQQNILVSSFKRALGEMRVEMDSDIMGKFVESTVANSVYS